MTVVYMTDSQVRGYIDLFHGKPYSTETMNRYLRECCLENGGTFTGRPLAGIDVVEFVCCPQLIKSRSSVWTDFWTVKTFVLGLFLSILSKKLMSHRA